ncbi:MAG: RIP metalloprotease RseP [Pseudohongiella sp.]|jgi:regulator of sigma E protease|nr:RIP metalloprotease RseP [Pseudohongiella sp.]
MILDFITNVLALLLTLGILVTIHEFGHFWVARRCGVKVLKFSIGFGKAVKSWTGKDGVEYVIAPIPLGGYVKMLGQEDTTISDSSALPASQHHLSFAFKPLWQRMAIVAAGPLANFLLAFFIFWLVNLGWGITGIAPVVSNVIEGSVAEVAGLRAGDEILAVDGEKTNIWRDVTLQLLARMGESGTIALTVSRDGASATRDISIPINAWLGQQAEPNPVPDLGIVQFDLPYTVSETGAIQIELPAIIGEVIAGGRAELGGLQVADQVVSVNDIPVRGWSHWVNVIQSSPELALDVVVKRSGNETALVLRPARAVRDDGAEIGLIGAAVQQSSMLDLLPAESIRSVNYNFFTAVPPALQETWNKSVFVLDSVKKMVVGLISVKNINGPITIAQVAGETVSYGLEVYLGFLALLSISLGVLNLLPIPVLDGGHLLYYLIEAVIRRPVPEKIQAFGLQLGLLLISGIMVLAVYNDVNRLL